MNKQLVGQRFIKARTSYDRHAWVQKQAADDLADLIVRLNRSSFSCLMEIGAGTGFLTKALLQRCAIDRFYVNDLSFDSVLTLIDELSLLYPSTEFIPLAGDADRIAFPEELDAIVSSSTVQWLEDPQDFIRRSAHSLASHGMLALSTYGKGNLCEISDLTKIGLSYRSQEEWQEMVEPFLSLDSIESDLQTLFFNTPVEVLRHLQLTGVTGVSPYCWTRSSLCRFENEYNLKYQTKKGLSLSWNILRLTAQKGL